MREPARWTDRRGAMAGGALALYGLCLFLAQDRLVSFFDDEALIVGKAITHAPGQVLTSFLQGQGQHQHPPLYDVLLHLWMRLTGESGQLLRLPSVVSWCLAVWLLGATADRLWGRRMLALGIAMAWPLGLLLGTPAHWSALAMLGLSATTYAYVRWQDRRDTQSAALFAAATTFSFWTNYLSLAFAGVLALHFMFTRPDRRAWRQALAAGFAILAGIAPLLPVFFHELTQGSDVQRSPLTIVADIGYHAWTLLVSESVAPWSNGAIPAAIVGAFLLFALLRNARHLWLLAGLAAIFAGSGFLGILSGKRLGLFGPWLVLGLVHASHVAPRPSRILVPVAALFALGWIGILHGGWWASFRYVEPWDEVVALAMAWSDAGDPVLSDHPSFYLQAHYDLDWDHWVEFVPDRVLHLSERRFASLDHWREVAAGSGTLVYVRTVVDWRRQGRKQALEACLSEAFRVVDRKAWLPDPGVDLKRRFVADAPAVRVEVLRYEARRNQQESRVCKLASARP